MLEIGQYIRQMSGDQLRRLNHGWQAAVRRPVIPALPEALGPARAVIAPPFPQRFFQHPSTRRLQVAPPDRIEPFCCCRRHVFSAIQPQVLAACQGIVTLRH